MAIYIDEQQMVNNNMLLHEDRIKSPSSRFLDQTPTFVTYYHINDPESTTDVGFKDVYSIVGSRSPLRYNKIENFPLYGIEQVVLQLNDTEYGLDTDYESEATILPGTLKPLMNDFFIINVRDDEYVFRVTNIQYDTILTDNFYKISFTIYSLKETDREDLDKQVVNEHVCVLENIGTEENCIIEKKVYVDLREINLMYRTIIDFYTAMFYNKRHNVFIARDGLDYLYDPYLCAFVNKHGLFNEKNSIQVLRLTEQINDPKENYKYNQSVYKLIEMQDMELLSEFKYMKVTGCTYPETSFYRWYEKNIYCVTFVNPVPVDAPCIFSKEFVSAIRMNADVGSVHAELIKKHIRKDEIKIADIPLTLADELISMNDSLEVYFIIPLIMYIIRDVIKKELHVSK